MVFCDGASSYGFEMACTCRLPARCAVCNTPVKVPLSNLESSSGGALMVEKFARRDSAAGREGLRRLIEGTARCPVCGNTVHHLHSRSCVAEYLASIGVPLAERSSLLQKISFPEG
jgi:hypothetical protein